MTRIAELKNAIEALVKATSSFRYDQCTCTRCQRLDKAVKQAVSALRPRARVKLR